MDIPEGYMIDHRGAMVPEVMVKDIDKLRNATVLEIVKKSQDLNKILSDFKQKTMEDIAAFVSLSAEKYRVLIGGNKGNITLLSYDGKYKVVRSIAEHIIFDERLQVAKQLVDECIQDWSGGSRTEIKTLVMHAFEIDKQGKINTDRILSLRRLDISDPKWKKAMDAIADSIQVTGSKAYVRIYERKENDKYELINLDLATI
jgi:hypothetical protein